MKILVLSVLLSGTALAQTASKPDKPALAPPVITDVERAAIANIDKLSAPLIEQLGPLQQQRQQVIEQIKKENPGYDWVTNPSSHSEGLRPHVEPVKPPVIPTPPAAPKK